MIWWCASQNVQITRKLRTNPPSSLPCSDRTSARLSPGPSRPGISTRGSTSSVIAIAITASEKLTSRSNPRAVRILSILLDQSGAARQRPIYGAHDQRFRPSQVAGQGEGDSNVDHHGPPPGQGEATLRPIRRPHARAHHPSSAHGTGTTQLSGCV